LRFTDGVRGSLSGTLATMGPGVPYAIGAKWAHPDRPAIALVGDGAMQMNGLAELITVSRYWQQWDDPRLIVAVLHNNDLNQVTWEMRAMEGSPKFAESQTLPDVDYAAFARSLGLTGINVDHPDGVGPAWDTALSSGTPSVLDIRCDPDVPPIPPRTTFEQAKATASAVLHRDENAWGLVKQGIKEKVQDYLPGTPAE
jgi:pyruvate dehydrogenase (quinone)